jgi:hypothetical protein
MKVMIFQRYLLPPLPRCLMIEAKVFSAILVNVRKEGKEERKCSEGYKIGITSVSNLHISSY